MAFTITTGGSFTNVGGKGVIIPLPSSADYFQTWNITELTATNPNEVVKAEWFGPKFGAGASPANGGIRWVKTSTLLTVEPFSNSTASNGFTYVTVAPTVEAQAANAISDISVANPAVVTHTQTYSEGDFLRFYNTTGDLTIGGMVFQISSASSGTGYTLLGLPNTVANGLSHGTGGNTRRVSKYLAVEPQFMFITNIAPGTAVTAAPAGTIVSTSIDPAPYYVVGNKIHFSVPSSFGMTQIDQLTGTITAINISNSGGANVAAYNVLVDIDSSSFTAFAFPASAGSPTARLFATFAPAGSKTAFDPVTLVQTGYEFFKSPFHTGQFTPYMYLAGGDQSPAGSDGDIINWQAYKLET